MGAQSKPPLPAPTDTSALSTDTASLLSPHPDDVATDISRVTDKTSYSIPEDGSPVTITTNKKSISHHKHPSQTSLLIEYFEAGKVSSRPSVRVRVTPSAAKKSKGNGHDHIQITETGKDRKPSYTRRISLGGPTREQRVPLPAGTDMTYTDESTISARSGRPPVEVELLHNGSDVSSYTDRFMAVPSDISSMPPDSMLEAGAPSTPGMRRRRSRSLDSDDERPSDGTLKTLSRRRSRSLSRERIAHKAMEKIREQEKESKRYKRISSSSREEGDSRERSKSSRGRYDTASLYPSEVSKVSSMRSGVSGTSSINNPKLLQTVEDAIRRLILPELNALKEEQKIQKNKDKFDTATRDSYASQGSRGTVERSLSKSSSAPYLKGKPQVVLEGSKNAPGIVVSPEKIRKIRRSSKDSTSEHGHSRRSSVDTITREKEKAQRKASSESHHRARDAAVAGATAGALTAAALRHHDSITSMDDFVESPEKKERRRKRRKSKSRSRSASITESYQDDEASQVTPPVPKLPFRSEIQSDLTRQSIMSADTERPSSRSSRGLQTPIREVMRGSPRQVVSPAPSTPTKSPGASYKRGLGTYHENATSAHSLPSATSARSDKAKDAAIATAALAGATAAHELHKQHENEDEYDDNSPLSPIQSIASYEEGDDFIDPPVVHHRVEAIRSAANTPSRSPNKPRSALSIDSLSSAESSKLARNRKADRGITGSGRNTPSRTGDYEDETPRPAEFDSWLEKEHQQNEMYRQSDIDDGSELNYKRMTGMTATTEFSDLNSPSVAHDIKDVAATPDYVRTPVAVESAVASLHDPSALSVKSSQSSHLRQAPASQADSLSGGVRAALNRPASFSRDGFAILDEHSPSRERWGLLRNQAQALSEKSRGSRETANSPRQSVAESIESNHIPMGASALPVGHDPMPEIGYHHEDEESEINTNPSPIQGPGGQQRNWTYENTPPQSNGSLRDAALLAGGAGAGAALAHHLANQESAEFEKNQHYQPHISEISEDYDNEVIGRDVPEEFRNYHQTTQTPRSQDEGYVTSGQVGETPEPRYKVPKLFDDADLENFNPADYSGGAPGPMGVPGMDDPFRTRHVRAMSGTSHGMASPLYDSATGKGIDRIQSKDVVALMDHLTVRDAQRNARDTEILVTLVRSAAEMRNQFEEMKKFIAEQDKMIMNNTDKDAEQVVQRVLGGPRPQPMSPRTTRRASTDDGEDMPTKRKNVFRRALKGLSMKSSNDLTNIEGMLMRLLDEVGDLKDQQGIRPIQSTEQNSLNSYENLRAAPDPGYEPEGRAGTGNSPNQSGYFSNPSSRHVNGMHSGYDGRRGSEHRISTVIEGDEDEHEQRSIRSNRYSNDGMTTPTQEARRGMMATAEQTTPPEHSPKLSSQSAEQTPRSGEKKHKHKSSGSTSFFGNMVPKVSRWSKTTTSTMPEAPRDSQEHYRNGYQPYGTASRSGSNVNLNSYPEEPYQVHNDDRLRSRSQQSLVSQRSAAAAGLAQARSPSPLIPTELEPEEEDEEEDPKYQAHRNSLNLQHPQPRPGPTQRHQNQLETQALIYDPRPIMSPVSGLPVSDLSDNFENDQWGSDPSLSLNRARVPGTAAAQLSPVYSDRSYEQRSKAADNGPLVPPKVPMSQHQYDDEPDAVHMHSSPMNSGYLRPLEPIAEVRYSQEFDSRHLTPSPSVQPRASMQSAHRKITGPREMPSRSPSNQSVGRGYGAGVERGQEELGTVRRKPVARSLSEQPPLERELDDQTGSLPWQYIVQPRPRIKG